MSTPARCFLEIDLIYLHLCHMTNLKYKWPNVSDLELMGDNGGEVGAGGSASSSSSSPHSSSLSGVMLLPSHTE